MLKWILILLKALTFVPAVISMKRAERRVGGLIHDLRVSKTGLRMWEESTKRLEQSQKTAAGEINRLSKEKQELFKIVENMGDPENCTGRGCTVLRASTHGYAKRMRGAIRRDIEADTA